MRRRDLLKSCLVAPFVGLLKSKKTRSGTRPATPEEIEAFCPTNSTAYYTVTASTCSFANCHLAFHAGDIPPESQSLMDLSKYQPIWIHYANLENEDEPDLYTFNDGEPI